MDLKGALVVVVVPCRIPDTPTCLSWTGGSASSLQQGFDHATSSPGSVLVSLLGDLSAVSAFGYTYGIDFVGDSVRGNMDLRLLIPQMSVDQEINGALETIFRGFGGSSSVEATLSLNLDNVTFADAIVQLRQDPSGIRIRRERVARSAWVCH